MTRHWPVLPIVLLLASLRAGAAADPPAAEPDAEKMRARIVELIGQLGDDEYYVRERAQDELERIGMEAFDALAEAEQNLDTEIADRARYLLKRVQVAWIEDKDPPDVARIMQAYRQGTEESRAEQLRQLAKVGEYRGVPALCRVMRYERSPVLAKLAALEIIRQPVGDADDWPAREKLIRAGMGASTRAPAEWLRAYLAARDAPDQGAAAWGKLADAEAELLRQAPGQTASHLVGGLYREEVRALRSVGRQADSVAAMRQLIELEPEDSASLTELLGWLVEQKAWDVVDEAAKRFAHRFQDDPLVLYTLAEAAEAQGNAAVAEEMANRARDLNEGSQPHHLLVAYKLQGRGRFAWSEQEYRIAIEVGAPGNENTVMAQRLLAEMLHDQLRHRSGGETLQQAVAALEKARGKDGDDDGKLRELRARMHYFYACGYADDPAKAREHLLKGIDAEPTDADVLIGLYRLKDAPPDLRQKTLELIRKAADAFREQIRLAPDDSTPYNQLAWLISNTEGDQSEALRCSQKSLELKPDAAGYLDTLGRCYYAQGDYENAVKFQSQAVEMEPHSLQMQRQLELFRKALGDQPKSAAPEKPATPKPAA